MDYTDETEDYSKFSQKSMSSSSGGGGGEFLDKAMKAAKRKIQDQNQQLRSTSAFGKTKDHCLCKVLRPVIALWQISGVVPVYRENCEMKHKWKSGPVLVNFAWIVGNIIGAIFAAPTVQEMMSKFQAIDIYTFSIVLIIQFWSTNCIFLAANWNAPKFLKAWTSLHATMEEVAMPNFQKVKLFIYLLPLYMTQEIFVNVCIYGGVIFYGNLTLQEIPFTVVVGNLTANILPNLVTGIYAVFLCIVSFNFKTINNNLKAVLEAQSEDVSLGKHWTPLQAVEISRFRILHEKLCHSVRLLENAFGIQIMAVFIGTSVSFVTGIYGFIIGTQGLGPARMNAFIIGCSLTAIIGAARIVIVIWFCQNVMDDANGAAHILNTFNPETHSDQVNIQVDKFLHKLGDFPLQTRCCNIFQVGNGIYASAASTIVTYVLILIQFRVD